MKSFVSLTCLAVVGLWMGACGPSGGGRRPVDCAQFPTAPACQDVSSGDTTVSPGDASGDGSETTQCTPDCSGKVCGPNGCGGFCGTCTTEGTHCSAGACIVGECGVGGMIASGELKVAQGITFDKVTVTMEHKMDIDPEEDACVTSLIIELGRGFGCTLRVEANTATAPGGGLRITAMSFAADSQCPGFPDENEGQYTDFSRMRVLAVVPGIDEVPDANAPTSCVTTNFEVKLEGVLVEPSSDKTLNVASTTIRVSGEVSSIGSTTASCPCAASCAGKDCGSDGCGFICGVCADNELCDGGGQCQCIPSCEGKQCGSDGCGGSCGSCDAFETCDDGTCIACTPTCAQTAECGNDGCGGTCGECDDNETCNAQSKCACPGAQCGGACCPAGDKCNGGQCCTPQCNGKECGNDGCGGTCGTCTGSETCQANGQCSCTPDCNGKECGSNGCGGSCGACGGGETCQPSGICATQTGECDVSGFAGVAENAFDNTSHILYNQFTANSLDGPFDLLQVEMWKTSTSGTGYQFESGFEYQLNDDPYEACALCVIVNDGCGASSCMNATFYLATSGTIGFVSFATAAGDTLQGYLQDVILQEVTLAQTAEGVSSTVKPNGKTYCITDAIGFGPLEVVTPPPQ